MFNRSFHSAPSPRRARSATIMWSRTDSSGNTSTRWKVRRIPSLARMWAGMWSRTCPSKTTVPPLGWSWPHRQLNSVVFPAPLGPTRPTASPGATATDTSLRAATPPKRIEIERASSSGAAPSGPSAPKAGAGAPMPTDRSATERLSRHAQRRDRVSVAVHRTRRAGGGRPRLAGASGVVDAEKLADTHHPPALLVLDDALGVRGVGHGTEGEPDGQDAAEARWQIQGDQELDDGEPHRSLDGSLDGPGAGGEHGHHEDKREDVAEQISVHLFQDRAIEGAAEPRQAGRHGEDREPGRSQADPHAGGRDRAPPHGSQVPSDGPPLHQEDEHADERQCQEAQHQERAVRAEVDRPQHGTRDGHPGVTSPCPRVLEQRLVTEQGEGERHERQQ